MPTQDIIPAGLWRRLAALVYDLFLILALAMLYGGFVLALKHWVFKVPLAEGEKASIGSWGFAGLILTIEAFYWYFWSHGGQTLGMRAWRLQLRDRSDAPVSLRQAVLRGISAPLSLACGGLGYWWCLWDSNRDTWHDKMSGTRVVVLPKPRK